MIPKLFQPAIHPQAHEARQPLMQSAGTSERQTKDADKSTESGTKTLSSVHASMIKRRWLLISKMDANIPLPSPCVSVCQMDEYGICLGCQRRIEEIAGWSSFDAEHQLQIWKNLIKRLDAVNKDL